MFIVRAGGRACDRRGPPSRRRLLRFSQRSTTSAATSSSSRRTPPGLAPGSDAGCPTGPPRPGAWRSRRWPYPFMNGNEPSASCTSNRKSMGDWPSSFHSSPCGSSPAANNAWTPTPSSSHRSAPGLVAIPAVYGNPPSSRWTDFRNASPLTISVADTSTPARNQRLHRNRRRVRVRAPARRPLPPASRASASPRR